MKALRAVVVCLMLWHCAASAIPTSHEAELEPSDKHALRHRFAQTAAKAHHSNKALVEKNKRFIPVAAVGAWLAGTALGGLVLNLAASLIYDVAKWLISGGMEGSCTKGSLASPISTFVNVDNDLKRYCDVRELVWDPSSGASKEKTWHLHAHKGLTPWKKCSYDAKWGPTVGGKVYDCREATVEANVKKNPSAGANYMRQLKAKYPPDKFTWTYHAEDVSIQIKSCSAEYHQGYIRPTIAAPAGVFNPTTIKNLCEEIKGRGGFSATFAYMNCLVMKAAAERDAPNWEKKPYFFLLVEAWTGGDCTGEEKSPGVRYFFSYKVDLAEAKIIYFSTKDSNNRPVFPEGHYVLEINEASGKAEPKALQSYTEKTTGLCEELHGKQCGVWGRGLI